METILKDQFNVELKSGQIFLYAYPYGSSSAIIYSGIILDRTNGDNIQSVVCGHNFSKEYSEELIERAKIYTTLIKKPKLMIIIDPKMLPDYIVEYLTNQYNKYKNII